MALKPALASILSASSKSLSSTATWVSSALLGKNLPNRLCMLCIFWGLGVAGKTCIRPKRSRHIKFRQEVNEGMEKGVGKIYVVVADVSLPFVELPEV